MKIRKLISLFCFFVLMISASVSWADAPKELRIGNTSTYSGPLSAYAMVPKAAAAYINYVNDQKIFPYKLNFISRDDQFNPSKAVEQVRKLVEQDHVDLFFLTFSTPQNLAIWDYINEQKLPHLFLQTGAKIFDDPKGHPWTVPGVYPSFRSEGVGFAKYINSNLRGKKIGVFYQNDAFGKEFFEAFKKSLDEDERKLIVSEQTYQTSDPTVDSQVVNLKNSGAEIFVQFSSSKFTTQAIKKASAIGWHPVQFVPGVSNSIHKILTPAGLASSKGIISDLFVKDPSDPTWKDDPGMKEYLAWQKKYMPEGDPEEMQNLFGYNAAQVLVQTLKQAGNDLSAKNIIKQAKNIKGLSLPMLLPGIEVSTSPENPTPIKESRMAQFDGQHWVLLDKALPH